jgi:hypothetical protein
MVLKIRKIINWFIIFVSIIFIALSFCIRDSRLIAGLDKDGFFYYSDEFTGGVEDILAFGIAGVIFFPLTIFLIIRNIDRGKKKNDIFGKPSDLLFMFITIILQVLITYEWNDKSDFVLNFLYGTVVLRIWFICFLVIIFYFLYNVLRNICKF